MKSRSNRRVDADRICVLQAVSSVADGGLARYVIDLMANVDRDRTAMHMVCTHFEGPHFTEAAACASSSTNLGARGQLAKLRGLLKLIRNIGPDVVHTHQEPVALIAARLAGVPIRIETIHLAKYWLTDGHPATRAAARYSTTRYCVNNGAEKGIISPHVEAAKIEVIHPGLDSSRWTNYWTRANLPPGFAVGEASIVIGTIARLVEQKGVCHLVNAAASVFKSCPAARLLIVGDGDLRSELALQCSALGIEDRVYFTGHMHDAYRSLGAMDIFVMPSLFESWGFTAVEAMCAGVPVVCSDIHGPNEFIKHEQTGLLTPAGSAEDLANAILRLCRDGEFQKELGARGKRAINARFSVQSMVQRYDQIYRSN